jgi:hypothetical protein
MNNDLLSWIVLGGVGAALGGFILWLKILAPRQQRNAAIASIKQGQDVFLTWNYSPEDWKFAAAEFFEIKPRRLSENGKASFTERFVYITNGADEILYELVGEDRYVKHLTEVYMSRHSGQSVIRFEVRTKTVKKDDNGNNTMEEDYAVATFYVPVPRDTPAEGEKVLNFYKNLLDRNADAVAAVMPFGLGIFRK